MKLLIDREWCLNAAKREEGEVGAGFELTSADQLRPFITPSRWRYLFWPVAFVSLFWKSLRRGGKGP